VQAVGPQEVSDVNLPWTKKLTAVLTNPQFQVRTLTVPICLLAAAPVFAQAGGDPWTRAVQVLQQSFTTTVARGLALVAIVVGGLGFAYGEGGSKRLLAGIIFGSGMAVLSSFVTHLEWYSGLFARLKRFNFVYVGTEQSHFPTAEAEFTKRVRTTPPNAIHKLGYFQLRELEDTKQYSKISLTDLEFIGQAKKIFAGDPFDSIYQRWKKNEIWDSEISQELNDHYGGKQVNFATFLLPQDPLHFEQNSWFYRQRSVTT